VNQDSLRQDQPKFFARLILWTEKSVTKFEKYYPLAIAGALLLLIALETSEFVFRISDTFHIGEILIYVLLLGSLGILVEVVIQEHRKQQRSLQLLRYKHSLSLELLPHRSWDSLTALLTKQVAELLNARAAYLFFSWPLSKDLEPVAVWGEPDLRIDQILKLDCLTCLKENAKNMLQPHSCNVPADTQTRQEITSYCYPIQYKGGLFALFRFVLQPGQIVTDEQYEFLSNITDEIITALIAGQDQKRISELELEETALAERHAMSHTLHDNLGQNLGYLRMKLDQFMNQPAVISLGNEYYEQLKHMKDVADESYRFVRNKLEVTIPETTPLLVNYLQEHAKKVALRYNIEIQITSHGTPKAVPLELQRAIFFVFQEALSNVEKHAHASRVDVLLDWQEADLYLTVTDNGTGFDVQMVSTNRHFGLEIMQERMLGVGGSTEIVSSKSTGTTIRITAHIPVGKKTGKEVYV